MYTVPYFFGTASGFPFMLLSQLLFHISLFMTRVSKGNTIKFNRSLAMRYRLRFFMRWLNLYFDIRGIAKEHRMRFFSIQSWICNGKWETRFSVPIVSRLIYELKCLSYNCCAHYDRGYEISVFIGAIIPINLFFFCRLEFH